MNNEPKDKHFGVPLSEWISNIPNELEVDAVGLWQLVASGRDGFDFNNADLSNFLNLAITSLLEKGAKPVRASDSGEWVVQNQYGKSNETIALNILKEWMESGIDPDENGIWFSIYI